MEHIQRFTNDCAMYARRQNVCRLKDPNGSKSTRGTDASGQTLPLRRSKTNKYNHSWPKRKPEAFNVLPAKLRPANGLIVSLQFDFLPVYL
jgi:hypothetical protein